MEQSKLESGIESLINQLSGILTSLLTWKLIVKPIWGYTGSHKSDLSLTLLFTAISLVRGWLWRRLFNGSYQTRKKSFLEVCLNIGSGMILAILAWRYIVPPIWGYTITLYDNLLITIIFTSVAIARSYYWRRFFNNGIHKFVHEFVLDYIYITKIKLKYTILYCLELFGDNKNDTYPTYESE